jgi:undecaprenyl-diphosphatase
MDKIHLWQALVLGAIQGVSELFPISSLAQLVLIPALLGWDVNVRGSDYLAFSVALHLATAGALGIYFWSDWRKVLAALAGSVRRRKLIYDRESKFAWLLVMGTIVVAAVGLLAKKKVELLVDKDHVTLVAVLLIINGGIMILGDLIKKRSIARAQSGNALKQAEDMSLPAGTLIGASQSLAYLPGISRSGVTIIGGLLAGLSYEEASRFAFMLAAPVIALAGVAEIPKFLKIRSPLELEKTLLAAIVAGVMAYVSVKFLMRYFRHNQLWPFGCFCIAFGGYAWLVFTGHL